MIGNSLKRSISTTKASILKETSKNDVVNAAATVVIDKLSKGAISGNVNNNNNNVSGVKNKDNAKSNLKSEKKNDLDGFEMFRSKLKPIQKSKRDNGHDWFYKHIERKEKEAAMLKAEEMKPALPEPLEKGFKRKKAFIEFGIGDKSIGTLNFILANDIVPKTVENFLNLCSSNVEKRKYKSTLIHRIVRDVAIMGGDVDGLGGYSSFPGQKFFQDEGYAIQHRKRGILSMTSAGRDTNNSQFFITLKSLPHFDGNHVAFGYMTDGDATLKKISEVFTVKQAPVIPIYIRDCGEIKN